MSPRVTVAPVIGLLSWRFTPLSFWCLPLILKIPSSIVTVRMPTLSKIFSPLADNVNIEKLAKKTEGYVGADIEAVCREAALLTLRKDLNSEKVDMEAFEEAMKKLKSKSSTNEPLIQYS